mmetsp:Transcript_29963/g.77004  ORF Transcript_29963/g.77004 Transcript_29963/m.77004 type:complete len:439 (-) Transcript_29963:70-1386(-)
MKAIRPEADTELPLCCSSSPSIASSNDDLPLPTAPTTAVMAPAFTCTESLSRVNVSGPQVKLASLSAGNDGSCFVGCSAGSSGSFRNARTRSSAASAAARCVKNCGNWINPIRMACHTDSAAKTSAAFHSSDTSPRYRKQDAAPTIGHTRPTCSDVWQSKRYWPKYTHSRSLALVTALRKGSSHADNLIALMPVTISFIRTNRWSAAARLFFSMRFTRVVSAILQPNNTRTTAMPTTPPMPVSHSTITMPQPAPEAPIGVKDSNLQFSTVLTTSLPKIEVALAGLVPADNRMLLRWMSTAHREKYPCASLSANQCRVAVEEIPSAIKLSSKTATQKACSPQETSPSATFATTFRSSRLRQTVARKPWTKPRVTPNPNQPGKHARAAANTDFPARICSSAFATSIDWHRILWISCGVSSSVGVLLNPVRTKPKHHVSSS